MNEIYEDKAKRENKDDSSGAYSKLRLNPPELTKEDPNLVWSTKAHQEAIRSIEYVENEEIMFTSALDKKVKIFDAKNGKFLEALQQKYDKFEPVALAFKKPGHDGIFAPDLRERVDKPFVIRKKIDELEAELVEEENDYHKDERGTS
mmetsp:Transcript_10788/g.9331  ORF Transcript_10788/g.9331 Transcript_10788/m.9331 type:complete len:148 (+) Transcript_10788:1470-1913(+)